MEILRPEKQEVWGWPAAINFFLGGMGSGFYLFGVMALIFMGEASRLDQSTAFKAVGPALVAFGLAVLGLEAGRPLRCRYLLSRLKCSWMSRETLAAAVFISLALLDLFFPSAALRWPTVIAAASFLLSQGFLVYRGRGIAAWSLPLLPVLFVSSGLASGGGVHLLFSAWGGGPSVQGGAVLVLVLVGLDLAMWLIYLFGSCKGPSWRTTGALRRGASFLMTVGIGHVLPVLVLIPAVMMSPPVGEGASRDFLLVLAALGILGGGAALKAGVILRVGYLREVVLGTGEVDGR